MHSDVVTIYNYSKAEEVWYPTVVTNAELQTVVGSKDNAKGESSADSVKLFIPYKDDSIGGKIFVPPVQWGKAEDKCNTVTLKSDDFFVVGEFSIVENEADYTDGFYSHMRENTDYCFKITTVSRFKSIPHFEVGGA